MSEMKTAAYICQGCGIGERLDSAQMAKVATREGKMAVVREHAFLCNAEGVQMIKDDIEKEGVNHIMIAACSRRAKTEAFYFPHVAMARANIREGVIWSQPDTEAAREFTQEMADDYVRMGCAELKKMNVPEGNPDATHNKRILVVGGGVSGLTAALEAAETGYEVILVEKQGELGGWTAKLWKRAPARTPFTDPVDTGIGDLVARASKHPRIKVCLNSTIAETSGAPGKFSVKIATESGATATEEVGAIVQSTGFTNYDINKLPDLGGGKSANVVDQAGLERLALDAASQGKAMRRPSDGGEIKSVVFIQCAGQRDTTGTHLPYCSGHCCNTSIKQAMYFKDNNPNVETVVLYTDLRTPGMGEDFYRSGQTKGVVFSKGVASGVVASGNSCTVNFKDLILNEEVSLAADLVVLATGQVPVSGVDISLPEDTESTVKPISILNLTYRQGKDLPQLKDGLTDSHFICFPYESRRTGVYPTGSVRSPMDVPSTIDDATGAALKAIQCMELTSQGMAVHPRAMDMTYPEFFMQRCTQCKRCTVECPFGAINEDEKANPLPNPTRCRRCGVCMGACPERIISFKNYSVRMIGNMIKSINVPEDWEEKPRIVVLACENDAYPALDMVGINRMQYSPWFRVIPMRCLGSLNLIWVADSLSKGIDGILLLGCRHGDEYQCHFIKGSELANIRLSKVQETLDRLVLESARVRLVQLQISDYAELPNILNEFAEKTVELGPNPYKGF